MSKNNLDHLDNYLSKLFSQKKNNEVSPSSSFSSYLKNTLSFKYDTLYRQNKKKFAFPVFRISPPLVIIPVLALFLLAIIGFKSQDRFNIKDNSTLEEIAVELDDEYVQLEQELALFDL